MVGVPTNGLTAVGLKGTGSRGRRTGLANFTLQTGTSTKESSTMTSSMAMEFSVTHQVPSTMVTGYTTSKKAMELKCGQMAQDTSEVSNLAASMATVCSLWQMGLCFKESSWMISLKGKALFVGRMVNLTKESGLQTRCMDMVLCSGLMDGYTWVTSPMTRGMAMGSSPRKMGKCTRVNGAEESNTALAKS